MNTKKNIAIVAGGDSSEYVVSVKSGANVLKAINAELFTPWLIRIKGEEWVVLDGDTVLSIIDKADFSFNLDGQKIQFDYCDKQQIADLYYAFFEEHCETELLTNIEENVYSPAYITGQFMKHP